MEGEEGERTPEARSGQEVLWDLRAAPDLKA